MEFDHRKSLVAHVVLGGAGALAAALLCLIAFCGDLPQQRAQRATHSVLSCLLSPLALIAFIAAGIKALYGSVIW
jgi:hypothetical protein